MKALLLGNEAIARGLYEAGVNVVSSYPGTPSTEITESVVQYKEIYSEWAPNEKVAYEVAFGACTGGTRSFTAMKHVGLNVAADPLFTSAYMGVNGGMVCAVADDPGMHSSQNEQDSRHYAIAAKLPMLEPIDSAECLAYTKLAYDVSEDFDTPVFIRLSTRISHSRSIVELSDRKEVPLREYKKDVVKNVMMPAMARVRHPIVEERLLKLAEYAEKSGINSIEYNSKKIGIIASGTSYVYAHEAMGENASYLKLGMVNPLPLNMIKDFSQNVDKLYVIEEMDDIIETFCRKNNIEVIGKDIFSLCGEFSQATIAKAICDNSNEFDVLEDAIPPRPPVLCAGCPHRGMFYALKKFGLYVSGDIGCYTLGSQAPLSMIDFCVCMGASVSGLHGYNLARGKEAAKKSIAVLGDSTFTHSGITGLIDIVYNKGMSTVLVLDNSITGMTGHQNNPVNGYTISGEPTAQLDLEALAKAIGINRVVVVDPYDVEGAAKAVEAELNAEEPSLVIARRPCALLKSVKRMTPMQINNDKCVGCKGCLKVGCPALSLTKDENGKTKATIDAIQCFGCEICSKACNFSAIEKGQG